MAAQTGQRAVPENSHRTRRARPGSTPFTWSGARTKSASCPRLWQRCPRA